jgi:hypothetical protein
MPAGADVLATDELEVARLATRRAGCFERRQTCLVTEACLTALPAARKCGLEEVRSDTRWARRSWRRPLKERS